MVVDIHAQLMELLRARLAEPFKVPNDVIRQLRDDIIEVVTPKPTRKNGAAVMTPEASMAGDQIKSGQLDSASKTARPKIV
jgi:hypothetical protein